MLFSDFLQIVAVLLEGVTTVIAAVIALKYKKTYGWCIAVTFVLFVLFDIGRLFSLPLPEAAHALVLLVACGSMLYGIWLMYGELSTAIAPGK